MERWYSARNKKMLERQKQIRIQEAAPALLEALQNLSAAYDNLCHQVDEKPESNKYYMAALSAIAAARGDV